MSPCSGFDFGFWKATGWVNSTHNTHLVEVSMLTRPTAVVLAQAPLTVRCPLTV